jgi:hypothetical protein
MASFLPAASAPDAVKASFGDGAGIGIFTKAGADWKLYDLGGEPVGCGSGIPEKLIKQWSLDEQGCSAGSSAAARSASTKITSATSKSPATTQSLPAKIAELALTQVGTAVTPTSRSFSQDCDPYTSMNGPTIPNSDGCGFDQDFGVQTENEAWCADFVKWIWSKAGVRDDLNTINAAAISVYNWGRDHDRNSTVDPKTVDVGDSLVFFPKGTISPNGYADHVGIVTAVNPDGTIDMVNGDFRGDKTISVQYNTKLDLPSWSASVWGAGEQWVAVTPPQTPTRRPPTVSMSGPQQATTSTETLFSAEGVQPKGKIAKYTWAFGDGGSATGAQVKHVFRNPGWQTVTVTATSNTGKVAITHQSIRVDGTSTKITATPEGAHYYTTQPVTRNFFVNHPDGSLSQYYFDGTSWSYHTLPGDLAKNSDVAALNYAASPDWAMTQHAFFRGSDGALAQTSGSGATSDEWTTTSLSGKPAANSQIVAATVPDGDQTRPEVFYINSAGRLAMSTTTGDDTWSTTTLPGHPAGGSPLAVVDHAVGGTVQPQVFFINASGKLAMLTGSGDDWTSKPITGSQLPASTTDLAATAYGKNGSKTHVFFTDTHGRLAQAAGGGKGWTMKQRPGRPAHDSQLLATSYLSTDGTLDLRAFFITANGDPAETTKTSNGWATDTLGGTASSLLGISAYPDGVQTMDLMESDNGTFYENDYTPVNGTWYPAPLPDPTE